LRKFAFVFLACGALVLRAQDASSSAPAQAPAPNTNGNVFGSLASSLLQGDFVNYYAFASAVFNSTQQVLGGGSGGAGISLGGGIDISKHTASSVLALNYRGDFRDYANGPSGTGTDQYLSLVYSRRLGRRWSISFSDSAGILFYNTAYYPNLNTGGVNNNPFSPSTRFLSSGVFLTYQQTRRLSYTIGGDFFLSRYSYPGAIGSIGGIESASVAYQLTERTSIGGTYSHDNFYFQQHAGTTDIDGGYFNVKHLFGRDWNVHASAGLTEAHTYGIITTPVSVILGGRPVTIGYITGPYDTRALVPTFDGGVTRRFRTFSLSANAGRGVNPGNGTYLTSSHTYFGGSASKPLHASVISGNFFYSRVTSIANQVSQAYTQNSFAISYSRILMPHLSVYGTYQYLRYGTLGTYGSSSDNVFIFGVSFSSKNLPLSLP
jgi:hypothetical protein